MTKLSTVILVSATLALAGGCKKKTDATDNPPAGSGSSMAGSGSDLAGSGSSMAGSGSDMAGSGSGSSMAGSGSGTAPVDDTADKLEVTVEHVNKAKGAVTVTFTGIKVVKASFDPAKIEGGTAELTVDTGSLSSGIPDRDDDLKSNAYIDAAKFPAVTIKIDNVKKTGDKTYSADASVNLRDKDKKIPVTFEVVDQTADSIRIKGEAKFSRLDFGVGKTEDSAAPEAVAKLTLTLKKT